ncbi:(Fe-S)-binding protein, partial [Streptomyces sp. SID7803]|nr:(Fe-S)-binding protein [Streptomyces sp. SID7803]
MRIGLFATCLGDTLFPEAVKSTAVLLARLGHDVVFPPGQTCCGQMHVNTGYQREPVPLVRNFAEQFGDASIDAVVMPSGSCA